MARRRAYSVAERRELWERWRRGESVVDIARALDRVPGSIYYTLCRRGGVAPQLDQGAEISVESII
jgi:transposase-like protein